ncbi:hypothetical protein [uncultured Sunxiuqinia sp.]|uniref:hypothetical protein n=1 Tax=uncultured Sunxiuqinia sp. TaxID=1573825 RepID=UPI002AA66EA4|nr:hypothetical protein [uncultured Sunxiuqinia sp.]
MHLYRTYLMRGKWNFLFPLLFIFWFLFTSESRPFERENLTVDNQLTVDPIGDRQIDFDQELFLQLVQANDQTVFKLLGKDIQTSNPRSLSVQFAILTASFCTEVSRYFNSEAVFQQLDKILDGLLESQRSNGTIDAGGNKQSPPDTAFLIDNLGPAAKVLVKRNSEESIGLKKRLDSFLLKAGEALLTGGVHTPNHRWVISSALAHLHEIYGDSRYKERINQWLADGIYINKDGQYPERSRIYSKVVDQALITIATILDREDLLNPVMKNLETTYFLMEDNGDLMSLDSRRQDQNQTISASYYYWCYRFMANRFEDPFFAAVAGKIEQDSLFEKNVLAHSLIHFIDLTEVQQELCEAEELPQEFAQFFPATDLVRIKRGEVTASIFGGNDLPPVISSGRSSNPSFFTFRKGEAILEYMRLSTSFFNTGYFRSEGLQKDQNTYHLFEHKEAYYYQPLPADKRNQEGDYELTESLDGRFWSKMDFPSRPKTTIQSETSIVIRENDGKFELSINVDGPEGVEVTLDLCFKSGGRLTNVIEADNDGDYFLPEGYATYLFGNDSIQVGPGIMEHQNIEKIDGELYSTHFGSIKEKGIHLFLTGRTPFLRVIRLK